MKKKIELLCPARDLECGIAAITYGADAVYIGAPKFGARMAAGNPIEDIESLVKFAHKYWAKVYVVLNTILFDDELLEAEAIIHELYKIGVDALIIQDMAILEMDIPPIPLFASTQTHNYDTSKIKFLESVGIKRIILARELSLQKIAEIDAETNTELEFFVHGALCVAFSGQCYFSEATTGRSANRGDCSQACRMLYSLEDANQNIIVKNKYLLSIKDLNLSERLFDLIESGITSFKIEGRLKDASYVKNVTAFYRIRLDEIINGNLETLSKASSGKVNFTFVPDPERTFSRGFTEYIIDGENKDIGSIDTPKSLGKLIGTVTAIKDKYFEIESSSLLVCGDGICFFDVKNVLCGMNVEKVERNRIFSSELEGLKLGTKIYRNRDHDFVKMLANDKTSRKIPISITITGGVSSLDIAISDDDGCKISYTHQLGPELANNMDKQLETIITQFQKTGDTIFCVEHITTDLNPVLFIPVAKLNHIRRIAINLFEQEREIYYKRERIEIQKNELPYLSKKLSYLANVSNQKAREFYKRHGVETIDKAFELSGKKKGKAIMTTKYCIKEQMKICPLKHADFRRLPEPKYLNDGKRRYELSYNCVKCEMTIKS